MARIVAFGEMLMRLTARADRPGFDGEWLERSFCGAEANVAVNLAGLGHSTSFVSALPNNAIGESAVRCLQGFGVETASVHRPSGRIGLLFLEPGKGARPSRITYDRQGSSFANLAGDAYDWASCLDGADWLVVSGITAALGDDALTALRTAVATAKTSRTKVAFDSNYRPGLWAGREDYARQVLREMALTCDLLFAGRRAVAMMTGQTFETGNEDEQFAAAAEAMFDVAPRLQAMAATRREVMSVDHNRITALFARRNAWAASSCADLTPIVDRVGTGDAFASGVLHAVCQGLDVNAVAAHGLACSAWAHSVSGDFMRMSQADLCSSLSGVSDVRR